MVKGVNKNVIEINDTGSEIFERIVFYVAPKYGNISPKKLYKETEKFTFNFDSRATKGYKSLRKRIKRKKILSFTIGIFAAVLTVGITLFLIFK